MTAFVVVDLQNDFFPGGALGVKNGDQILPVINKLLKQPFDLIIGTKDWHPQNHGSFAETHGKKVGEVIDLNGLQQILWPTHCVQGTRGAEFSDQWDHDKVERVFYKGTDPDIDSYSAFYDNGHRKSTGLHEYLQSKAIKEIYIAGLASDYCVKYSVLDALKLGYSVYVVIDGCKPVNLAADDEEKAMQEMLQAGANLIHSHELNQSG
jgi:nicotinamidase/pyrazinamidase